MAHGEPHLVKSLPLGSLQRWFLSNEVRPGLPFFAYGSNEVRSCLPFYAVPVSFFIEPGVSSEALYKTVLLHSPRDLCFPTLSPNCIIVCVPIKAILCDQHGQWKTNQSLFRKKNVMEFIFILCHLGPYPLNFIWLYSRKLYVPLLPLWPSVLQSYWCGAVFVLFCFLFS